MPLYVLVPFAPDYAGRPNKHTVTYWARRYAMQLLIRSNPALTYPLVMERLQRRQCSARQGRRGCSCRP